MKTLLTEAEIQRIFFIFLGRECEPPASEYFRSLGLSSDALINIVINSSEYQHRIRFCISSAGKLYNYVPPPNPMPAKHPLSEYPRASTFHVLHSFYDAVPDLSFNIICEPNTVSESDIAAARRIIEAFRVASHLVNGFDQRRLGVWRVVGATHHLRAEALLRAGDPQAVATYLANGLRTSLSYGLLSVGHLQSEEAVQLITNKDPITFEYKLLLKDRMVRLAEALGTLPVENPEQGRYGTNIHVQLGDLVRTIEEKLHTPFDRPRITGLFGIEIDGKLYDPKAAEDAYLAHRAASFGMASVEEIGGGFGGMVMQLSRYGIWGTVFDLPVVNALQAFFLIGALGGERVRLVGEDEKANTVGVLPWPCFFEKASRGGLVINRDSMAEFEDGTARRYCRQISDRCMHYLSINQEVENESGDPGVRQLNVGRLAQEARLVRLARVPYWMRRGYVEELFAGQK